MSSVSLRISIGRIRLSLVGVEDDGDFSRYAIDGMKLLMRRKLEKTMEGDFETDSMRYKATERYQVGFTDWRAMYGTPGV
jgi:hypothetical protein